MTTEERKKILKMLPRGAEVRMRLEAKLNSATNNTRAALGPFYKKIDGSVQMVVYYSGGLRSTLHIDYKDLTCDAIEIADKLAPGPFLKDFFVDPFKEGQHRAAELIFDKKIENIRTDLYKQFSAIIDIKHSAS